MTVLTAVPPAGRPVMANATSSAQEHPTVRPAWSRCATSDADVPIPLGHVLNDPQLLLRLRADEMEFGRSIDRWVKRNAFDETMSTHGLLNKGSSKQIFAIAGDPDHVLVVQKPGGRSLTSDLIAMKRLDQLGIPTPNVKAIGSYRGRPALMMERFPLVYKMSSIHSQEGQDFLDDPRVNQKTAEGLKMIMEAMEIHKFGLNGLQIGIRSDGRACVCGPFEIIPNRGHGVHNGPQRRQIDDHIQMIERPR